MQEPLILSRKQGFMAVFVLLFVVLAASGCVTVQSFPMSARAGDTVILAVGSPDGMTTGNTTATFTPDGGTAVPVTIRSVFKLYPDKTSAAWLNSSAVLVERDTGHGPWTTMIAIDLPTGLSSGPGSIQITTTAAYPPPPARNINDADIALEILPGTGVPSPFSYEVVANLPVTGDLSQLEPQRRIVIRPSYTGESATRYGAIEIRIDMGPILDGWAAPDLNIIADEKVRLYSPDQRVHYIWSMQGSEIVVSFISPTGGLEYSQAHFSVISDTIMSLVDSANIDVSTLTPVVTYYDINGNAVAGGDTFLVVDET